MIIVQIIIIDPKAHNLTKWNLKVSISMLRNQISLRKIIFSNNFISLVSVFLEPKNAGIKFNSYQMLGLWRLRG